MNRLPVLPVLSVFIATSSPEITKSEKKIIWSKSEIQNGHLEPLKTLVAFGYYKLCSNEHIFTLTSQFLLFQLVYV